MVNGSGPSGPILFSCEKNITFTGLQIYSEPGSLSHDIKIWLMEVGPVDPYFLVVKKISLKQAFRFMVSQGHCPML